MKYCCFHPFEKLFEPINCEDIITFIKLLDSLTVSKIFFAKQKECLFLISCTQIKNPHQFPISNCEHVYNKNNISYLNRRTTRAKLEQNSSLSFLCMSFLYKTFIVIIKRNEKGNCQKLIEREGNLPHSSLCHPLIQELKWEKWFDIFFQVENKNATKYLFCKSTICRILVLT